MTDRDFILAPHTVAVTVALEPVLNILSNMMLLYENERLSGFSQWVTDTAARLSPKQQHFISLAKNGLYDALMPDQSWGDFASYVDHLHHVEAESLRDRTIAWFSMKDDFPGYDVVLADSQVYIDFIRSVYESKHEDSTDLDVAGLQEVHRLLNDPETMKATLLEGLEDLWDSFLYDEWERTRATLQQSVEAFQEMDYSGLTAIEAVRAITQRDMGEHWGDYLQKFEHVIFVPSVNIGPYLTSHHHEDTAWVIFRARIPEGARTQSTTLDRSELLVQMSALADDTRLRILELVVEHGELCAQDIMTMLGLSQSSASRHLRQLTASGFLTERRREVAKCYALNLNRIDTTLSALRNFLPRKQR